MPGLQLHHHMGRYKITVGCDQPWSHCWLSCTEVKPQKTWGWWQLDFSWIDHRFLAFDGIWWYLYRLPILRIPASTDCEATWFPYFLQPCRLEAQIAEDLAPKKLAGRQGGCGRVSWAHMTLWRFAWNWDKLGTPKMLCFSSFSWDIPYVFFGETHADARLGSIAFESVGVRSWSGGFEVLVVCISDSTDVMAMLQCFAVAQQERAWELGFHIFHPECIKRVWSS